MSVLVNKPSQLSVAVGTAEVTVDLVLLENKVNTLDVHPRWKDSENWKSVEFIYENASKQRYKIVFKIDQNNLSFNVDFPATTRDGMFSCVVLNIAGYNSDFLEISRSEFLSLFGSTNIFDINAFVETFVINYTSPPVGSYDSGTQIEYQFTFSKPVTVTGNPRIDVIQVPGSQTYFTMSYISGSGTNTLTFGRTINPTITPALNVQLRPLSPISLNGGSIKDLDGNNAILTFDSYVAGPYSLRSSGILGDVRNTITYNNNVYFLAQGKPIIKLNTTTNTLVEIVGTKIENLFDVEIFNNKIYFFNLTTSLAHKLYSLDSSDNLTQISNIKGSTITDIGRQTPFLRKSGQHLYTYLSATVPGYTSNNSFLYRIDTNNTIVRLGMFDGSGWVDGEIVSIADYNNTLHFIMTQYSINNLFIIDNSFASPQLIVKHNYSSPFLLNDLAHLIVANNKIYLEKSGALVRYNSFTDYDYIYDQNNDNVFTYSQGAISGFFSGNSNLYFNTFSGSSLDIGVINLAGTLSTLTSIPGILYPTKIDSPVYRMVESYPNNGSVTIANSFYFFSRFDDLINNTTRLVMYKLNEQTLTYVSILETPIRALNVNYEVITNIFAANNELYYTLGSNGAPGIKLYKVDSNNNHVRIV